VPSNNTIRAAAAVEILDKVVEPTVWLLRKALHSGLDDPKNNWLLTLGLASCAFFGTALGVSNIPVVPAVLMIFAGLCWIAGGLLEFFGDKDNAIE